MRWNELPEFQQLPDGWEVVSLVDKADVIAGQSPASDLYNQNGHGLPFLQGNAEFGAMHPTAVTFCAEPKKLCKEGDTLISVRAPVGEINRADRVYGIGRGLAAIQPREIESDYLFFGMHRWRFPLQRIAQGSTFDAVTARHFRQLKIAIPKSKEERYCILEILQAAGGAVEAAEGKLLAARRLKTALLQQLFTHGLPGRHTRFQETKIGRIPAEWEVVPLRQLATVDSGVTLNQERSPRSNPKQYLTVVNVQRERLDLTEVRFLEMWPSEIPAMLLQVGDILVVEGHANSHEIGRAAIVTPEAAGMTFQNHLFRVRLLDGVTFNRRFLLGWLNSERVRRHWNATANTSSGLNTINRRGLRRLLIPKPRSDEQEEIAGLLEAADANIEAIEREVEALRRLKRSLLQNLLTGKVRVKGEVTV